MGDCLAFYPFIPAVQGLRGTIRIPWQTVMPETADAVFGGPRHPDRMLRRFSTGTLLSEIVDMAGHAKGAPGAAGDTVIRGPGGGSMVAQSPAPEQGFRCRRCIGIHTQVIIIVALHRRVARP